MFMFQQFCDMLISVEEAFPLSISQQLPGMQTVCCPLPLFVALKNVIYGTILITTNFKLCLFMYMCRSKLLHVKMLYRGITDC